jgi:hypothetical protein
VVAIFRLIERAWPASAQTKVMKWLGGFGAASLSAYFFHEMLLYHRWFGVFTKLFRESADWPLFWLLVAALIFATWLCVKVWDRLEPKLRAKLTSSAATPPPAS